MSGLFQNISG